MVRNSVNEILAECDKLFSIAESAPERIDVFYACKNLRDRYSELKESYQDDSKYNEVIVKHTKDTCNKAAISLEAALTKFDEECRKRHEDRVYLQKVIADVEGAITAARLGNDLEHLKMILIEYSYVLDKALEAAEICFSLTEEERENLEKVQEDTVGIVRVQAL